jgi:hypothetical protein
METKIQNKKVIYSCGRLLCNGKGIDFSTLVVMVEHYLHIIRKAKDIPNLIITHEKINTGMHFELFGMIITVNKLFELYNEIAEKENIRVYTELSFNPKGSVKINPINVS